MSYFLMIFTTQDKKSNSTTFDCGVTNLFKEIRFNSINLGNNFKISGYGQTTLMVAGLKEISLSLFHINNRPL